MSDADRDVLPETASLPEAAGAAVALGVALHWALVELYRSAGPEKLAELRKSALADFDGAGFAGGSEADHMKARRAGRTAIDTAFERVPAAISRGLSS